MLGTATWLLGSVVVVVLGAALGCSSEPTSAKETDASVPSGGAQGSLEPGVGGAGGALGGNGGGAGASGGAGAAGMPGGGDAGAVAMPAVDVCGASPAGAVVFSTPSGTFQGSVTVELTTSEAGAEIRFTTDRTAPSAASQRYTEPLRFTTTTNLRAQAFDAGSPIGAAADAIYISSSLDATHDVPVMVLDSYGVALPAPSMFPGSMTGREYIDVASLVYEPRGGAASLSSTPTVASAAAFRIRGQSSAFFAKRPYRLELRDGTGDDRDCPMLGMPAEADWVLHPPFPDKALIRNAFAYSLGRDLGMAAPRAALIELYVNSAERPLEAGDYQGVYLLVETIKNQKNRLDLKQLEVTDTTLPAIAGGYIFKFEWQVMDIEQQLLCPAGQADCWNWLEVVDPSPWAELQQAYLTDHVVELVNALHSAAPADPAAGYPAYIDVPSFVDQVIVHELTRNMDAYARSQFFYKDRDTKIFAGPLWDFDLIAGVGTSTTFANLSTSGFQYESNASRLRATADWFPVLLAEPTFHAALVARWRELRGTLLSDAAIQGRIGALTQGLAAAADRNFARWPNLTTARIGFFETPTAATWHEQVMVMQSWLLDRAAWLDGAWQ